MKLRDPQRRPFRAVAALFEVELTRVYLGEMREQVGLELAVAGDEVV